MASNSMHTIQRRNQYETDEAAVRADLLSRQAEMLQERIRLLELERGMSFKPARPQESETPVETSVTAVNDAPAETAPTVPVDIGSPVKPDTAERVMQMMLKFFANTPAAADTGGECKRRGR